MQSNHLLEVKQCKQLKSMKIQSCGEFLQLDHFYPGKTTCKKCTCLDQKIRRQQDQKLNIDYEEVNRLSSENIQLRIDLEEEKLKNDSLTKINKYLIDFFELKQQLLENIELINNLRNERSLPIQTELPIQSVPYYLKYGEPVRCNYEINEINDTVEIKKQCGVLLTLFGDGRDSDKATNGGCHCSKCHRLYNKEKQRQNRELIKIAKEQKSNNEN